MGKGKNLSEKIEKKKRRRRGDGGGEGGGGDGEVWGGARGREVG